MRGLEKPYWQSAWIVGGSTGLGAALSKQLHKVGTKLFVSARNTEQLKLICTDLVGSEAVPLDVADYNACGLVTDLVKFKLGELPDLVIINAGIYTPMNGNNFEPKDVSDMMNVNFMGVVNLLKSFSLSNARSKLVTVAVVSSPSGWRGLPGGGGYGASKAAVTNFVESMKLEMESQGIDLRLVNPGFIKTRLTDKNEFDMPQLMEPEYAAILTLKGLQKGKFENAFPNPFVFILKVMRILPYSFYFWLMKKKSKS